jgi:hypothetical protein
MLREIREIVNYEVRGLPDVITPTSLQRQHEPDNHGREHEMPPLITGLMAAPLAFSSVRAARRPHQMLVLHAGEPSVPQKIIPLGVFDLPASKDQPASVLLLKANPDLMGRINKEAAAGDH